LSNTENNTRGPNVHNLRLYVTLQAVSSLFCWAWFAGLWAFALNYSLGDLGWWLLVLSACAGLYGLRPNLERAIDSAWLRGISNSKVLAERVAELRPIKRRIDLIFSMLVFAFLMVLLFVWLTSG
jgi:hypothetical protein